MKDFLKVFVPLAACLGLVGAAQAAPKVVTFHRSVVLLTNDVYGASTNVASAKLASGGLITLQGGKAVTAAIYADTTVANATDDSVYVGLLYVPDGNIDKGDAPVGSNLGTYWLRYDQLIKAGPDGVNYPKFGAITADSVMAGNYAVCVYGALTDSTAADSLYLEIYIEQEQE